MRKRSKPGNPPSRVSSAALANTFLLALCLGHFGGCWRLFGGSAGIASSWPVLRDDHPWNYYYAVTSRTYLRTHATTAGYDPSFMAGYPKSVLFPTATTLPELIVALCGGARPVLVYNLYVLSTAAAAPWLLWLAARLWRCRGAAAALGVLLYLVYFWTDFPVNYVLFGMLPFLISSPLALLWMGVLLRYLERGGAGWWAAGAALGSLLGMVHVTAAVLVAPAALAAYFTRRARAGALGFWFLPPVILLANLFWLLPGIAWWALKGATNVGFINPNVGARFAALFWQDPPIQLAILACLPVGLRVLSHRDRTASVALAVLLGWAFFWGYLAGWFRALDFFQPGRHTLHVYTWGALAAGLGLTDLCRKAGRALPRSTSLAGGVILLALAARLFAPSFKAAGRAYWLASRPLLATRPRPRHERVFQWIGRHLRPGERLLFEECNKGDGVRPDPFEGFRLAPLIPLKTGVEVIGGPYLSAHLKTNFTQFGDGKLFGQVLLSPEEFQVYACIYDPRGILCWSPWWRDFCRKHPELIEVVEDDGVLLFGLVRSGTGPASVGSARVKAWLDRIEVESAKGSGPEENLVLRYHHVPGLTTDPPLALEPVRLGNDPVPFIGVNHPPARFTIQFRGWRDLFGRR